MLAAPASAPRSARKNPRPPPAASFSPSCRAARASAPPRPRLRQARPAGTARTTRGSAGSTCSPRWRSTLRTSRFLPSRIANVSQTLAPCSRSSVASIGAVADAVDRDAVAQRVELRLRDLAVRAHAIAPQPAGRRQFQRAREPAVVGQQQQAFGVEIEPADADQRAAGPSAARRRWSAGPAGRRWWSPARAACGRGTAACARAAAAACRRPLMLSAAVTLSAGEVIFAPLTATRPAAIQASASRREASPARAITLAMRSPLRGSDSCGHAAALCRADALHADDALASWICADEARAAGAPARCRSAA